MIDNLFHPTNARKTGPEKCAPLWALLLLLSLFLMIPFKACASQKEESLRIIVTSDLHYTLSQNATDLIVPGVAFADEIADALVEEVIAIHPDLFIMTGDNTNGGDLLDVEELIRKLKRIKDAGIPLIITTGNHDYHKSTPEDFKAAYFPLLEYDSLAPDSLSYTVLHKGILFIAMDDNAASKGEDGRYSPQTIDWLKGELSAYEGYPKVFLAHHSLMQGKGSKKSSPLYDQNQKILRLLKKAGVRLLLVGHMHSQSLSRRGQMYELISSMPYASTHLIGFLTLSKGVASYQAHPLDLARYGAEGLSEKVREKDQAGAAFQRDSFARTIGHSSFSPLQKEMILNHFLLFLRYMGEGSLKSHLSEFLNEDRTPTALTEKMIQALWDYNYGPWIDSLFQEELLDASQFEISYVPE